MCVRPSGTWNAACSAICLTLLGCTLGPAQITASRTKYNLAVQMTANEQMLINLVRLKYRDAPEFLAVGGISSQYAFEGDASIAADLRESLPDALGIGGSIRRSEKPTITYIPLRDEVFNRRFISPIGLDTLALLTRTGWAWDRVFRISVQNLNGLDNATSAGGPTPQEAPEFESFQEVCGWFRELQKNRRIEIASEEKWKELSDPIDAENVKARDVVLAAEKGYRFRPSGNEGGVALFREEQFAALKVHADALFSPEMYGVTTLLNLEPGRLRYRIRLAIEGQVEAESHPKDEETLSAPAPGEPGFSKLPPRQELYASTRSLLEMMFYLCHAIDAPTEHIEQGLVTITLDENGDPFDWGRLSGDLLRIQSSPKRPKCAYVAVPYRGYWFYIDDRDLASKSTFGLLSELYNIEIRGGGAGNVPVLTLDVGG